MRLNQNQILLVLAALSGMNPLRFAVESSEITSLKNALRESLNEDRRRIFDAALSTNEPLPNRIQTNLEMLPSFGVPSPSQSEELEPDWSGKCEICGQSPIVPVTGMCGPCTFGDASTMGGNW